MHIVYRSLSPRVSLEQYRTLKLQPDKHRKNNPLKCPNADDTLSPSDELDKQKALPASLI